MLVTLAAASYRHCRRMLAVRQASRVLRVHHHETAEAAPGRIMASPPMGAAVLVCVTGA
jgi:hypothetical protein